MFIFFFLFFFFFNDTATTEIYTVSDTLSLHDALPIYRNRVEQMRQRQPDGADLLPSRRDAVEDAARDDQMSARVVVAEREAEPVVVPRGDSADERRRPADRERNRRRPAQRARMGHIRILWEQGEAAIRTAGRRCSRDLSTRRAGCP